MPEQTYTSSTWAIKRWIPLTHEEQIKHGKVYPHGHMFVAVSCYEVAAIQYERIPGLRGSSENFRKYVQDVEYANGVRKIAKRLKEEAKQKEIESTEAAKPKPRTRIV